MGELVQPRKGSVELLNSDDHKGILAKNKRDIGDMRPDITHQCIMALLDSPLRVPRTYKRFAGLACELLQKNKIRAASANETLMKVISNPIEKYLPPGPRRFGLSVSGRKTRFRDFAKELSDAQGSTPVPIVFCLGAVAHSDPVIEP